jgi:hypothetical protein
MQRMNATCHPGYEYTLRVTYSALHLLSQANIIQWNQMLLGLCNETHCMYTSFEDCSHNFEFVILYRKKQTTQWQTLHVGSVSVDVTRQFLMYIADAIWHVHRRLAWKQKLIAFLLATENIEPEHVGHGDLISY